MNLRSLEYYLAVVEEMSFSRAAERLFLTQQALSSHIKRLEEEYGAEFFRRKPVLSLTKEGEEMRYWAMRILTAEKNLKANLYDIGTNCRGHLRVGIARLRADRIMPEILVRYREIYPNVSFELVDGATAFFQECLEENKVDMYLGVNVKAGQNEADVRLVDEAVWWCANRSFLRRFTGEDEEALNRFLSGEPDLRTLPDLPLLVTGRSNRIRPQLDRYYYEAGVRPVVYLESDSQPLLIDLAKKGMGIAVISPIALYNSWREINDPAADLCAFPLSRSLPDNVISLVYRKGDPLPQYAKDFIRIVKEIFGSYGRLLDMEERPFI